MRGATVAAGTASVERSRRATTKLHGLQQNMDIGRINTSPDEYKAKKHAPDIESRRSLAAAHQLDLERLVPRAQDRQRAYLANSVRARLL
jgi:hypothetical protein